MSQTQTSKTLTIVQLSLEDILGSVWKGVSEKNVEKMAPQATNLQSDHAVQSFVYQSFTERFKGNRGFKKDEDPIPAQIDTLGSGTLQAHVRPERKMSKQMQPSIFGQKSRSIISDISKKSGISGQLRSSKSKQNTEEKSKKESFFISLGYVEQPDDQDIEKVRKRHSQQKEEELRSRRLIEEKNQKSKENALAQEKVFKEKGEYTFDYEGFCYGVQPGKIQSQTVQTMRQFLSKPSVQGKDHHHVEPTTVQNQKIQNRQEQQTNKSLKDKPQLSQKSFSLAQVLGDPSKISEGVKITELRNNKDNLILENKSKKLDGLKQYRLKDYKSIAKEKSFVQFSRTTTKKHSMHELSLTPSENKQPSDRKAQTSRPERVAPQSRGKSEHEMRAVQTNTILESALGRGLPFIRTKGLRFYDIGVSNNTFRTLEPNSTSRRSSKSKSSRIKIDDCQLFQQTILN